MRSEKAPEIAKRSQAPLPAPRIALSVTTVPISHRVNRISANPVKQDGAGQPERCILGIAAPGDHPPLEGFEEGIAPAANPPGPGGRNPKPASSNRPVGCDNDERPAEGGERYDPDSEINPGGQESRRFSRRYQVRPPM